MVVLIWSSTVFGVVSQCTQLCSGGWPWWLRCRLKRLMVWVCNFWLEQRRLVVVVVEVLHEESMAVLGATVSVIGFLSIVGLTSLHQGVGLAV